MVSNVATLSGTNRGIKDRMLSAYKLWFVLSILAGLLGAAVVVVRGINESNLGPMMLTGDVSQTAMQIEAVTSRLWMQLFLFSMSFAKLGIVSAIYVSIKNIRAKRGVNAEGAHTPFYERFYKVAPIIGSEIQTLNVFVVSVLWVIFASVMISAQYAGDTAVFASAAERFLGAAVVPFEFFGASFSLAGIIFALAAYAAEPKGDETRKRVIPAGLLGFGWLTFILGLTGFLVLFPLRAYAIATIIAGPATANFAGAMKIDAVLNLVTEQWMFIGVGGLFLIWALWLWQIAKKDHANCCVGKTFWASRLVPALAVAGFLVVAANFVVSLVGIAPTIDVVEARMAGVSPGATLLTERSFFIVTAMAKMFGVGMMLGAIGFGSMGLLSYARLGLHGERPQEFRSRTTWQNWAVIVPGLAIVAAVTIPVTIWLVNLMPQWAPVIMMGAPGEMFPGFQQAFLNFRLMVSVAAGAMMLGLVMAFWGAFAYKLSAVKAWAS